MGRAPHGTLDRHDTTIGLGPTCAAWIADIEGELLSTFGRHDEAIERFETAIRLASSVGSHFVARVAEVSSLAASARTGDVTEALVAFRPRLVEYREMRRDTHGIATLTALRRLHFVAVPLMAVLTGTNGDRKRRWARSR